MSEDLSVRERLILSALTEQISCSNNVAVDGEQKTANRAGRALCG
jgi:hypothetical protein